MKAHQAPCTEKTGRRYWLVRRYVASGKCTQKDGRRYDLVKRYVDLP